MKSFNDLAKDLEKKANNFVNNQVEKALKKTAQNIYDDLMYLAPGNGPYKESIKIYPIEKDNEKMSIFIGSDLMVGPTKWGPTTDPYLGGGYSNNAPAGTRYNLGYLLEHGTYEHAIPNAFGLGNYWSFTDNNGTFHKGTLEESFHPGTIAQPHYSIALEKNKNLLINNIKVAWREK